jgi:hypothetical protein
LLEGAVALAVWKPLTWSSTSYEEGAVEETLAGNGTIRFQEHYLAQEKARLSGFTPYYH